MARKLVFLALLVLPLSVFAEFRSEVRTDETRVVAADVQPYVDAMNRERLARGEKPLRLNRELCAAANDRVRDMLTQHYFAHDAPDGTQPFVWADREGYAYTEIGENLAVGYRTPDDVVDGWMHSPKHRDNVLNDAFVDVGVAVATDSPTRGFRGPLVVALYGVR
jgi:uncharacterized protein YkwD